MSNYKYNGVDFDNICEPRSGANLITCNVSNFSSTYFTNIGDYASNSGYQYDDIAFPSNTFIQNGASVVMAKLGYRPRTTQRFTLSTPGTYYLARVNDNNIKLYNSNGSSILVNLTASSFSLNIVPQILIFYLAGGGGGGGGGSGTASSGGGAGGGVVLAWLKVPTITSDANYANGAVIIIGSGGAGGAGGTGSNAKRGSTGTASSITNPLGGSITCNPGTGGANFAPEAGTGGSVSYTTSDGNLGYFAIRNGGNGGINGANGDSVIISNQSISPEFTYSNTGNGGSSGGTSAEGGGGSYGNGGNAVPSSAGAPGDKGGGGGGGVYTIFNGKSGGNGGNGYAAFYY